MATSLGQLFYSLSLDSKDFEKKIKDLTTNVGNMGGSINLDKSSVEKAIHDVRTLRDAVLSLSQGVSLNISGVPKTISTDLTATISNASDLKAQIESALSGVVVSNVQVDTSAAKKAFDAQVWNVQVTANQSNVQNLINRIKQVMGINRISVNVSPQWTKADITKLKNELLKAVGTIDIKNIKVTVDRNYIQKQLDKAPFTANVDLKVNSAQAKSVIASAASSASNLVVGGSGSGNSNGTTTTIEKQNKALTDQLGIRRSINDQMSKNTQLATMLGNAMGNVFGAYMLKNFLENLVQIGGEIQKQRMALGHILQSESEASEIFGQMKNLAVKSPFGLLDLMSNARQLSAFGVQYNELYDTMKRLSDVASGLGIQFGRLSLAYGETMERGFLDGKLVRQFSYMGLPVLQKIAEYYNEIHKNGQTKLFDAKQVREMVSNRDVSFEDLKAVIQSMTDEGGQFANMQEVMAESVAGKWKNLSDAIEVMYSNITEGNSGLLKAPAEILTKLTRHYDEFASVLAGVASIMVGAKTASLLYATTMGKVATATWGEMQAENANKTAIELRTAAMNKANLSKLISIARGKEITAQQIKELATGKALTAEEQAELAVRQKSLAMKLSLTTENIRYMHSLGLITTNQKAYATSTNLLIRSYGKLSISLRFLIMQANQAAASFLAMSAAMLTNPMTWLMAGISGLMLYNEKSDEAKRKQDELASATAKAKEEMLKSSTEMQNSAKGINLDSATDAEMQTAIKDMVELVKNQAADAPSILATIFSKDKDGKYIKDVKTQFKELMDVVGELRDYALGEMDFTTQISDALDAADGVFDDSPLENAADFLKEQKELRDMLAGEIVRQPILATSAFNQLRRDYHDKLLEIFDVKDVSQVSENQLKELMMNNKGMLDDFLKSFNKGLMDTGGYKDFVSSYETMLQDVIATTIRARRKISDEYSQNGKALNWSDANVRREWIQDIKQVISVKYGDQNAQNASELLQRILQDPTFLSKVTLDTNTNPDQAALQILSKDDIIKNVWLNVRKAPSTKAEDVYETAFGDDAKGASDYVDALEKTEKAAHDHYAKLHRLAKENKIKLKKESTGLYSIDATDKTTQLFKDAEAEVNKLNNELRKAKEQGVTLDYLTKEEKKTTKTKTEDTQLKAWKEQFDELKKAYSEYQKWEAKVGKENAAKEIASRGLVSQSVLSAYKINIKDFADAKSFRDAIQKFYDKIKGSLKGVERQKFDLSIKAQLSEIDLSIKEEAIQKAKEKAQRELNQTIKQWDLYKAWESATGDIDSSLKMSVLIVPIYDEKANDLKKQLQSEIGSIFYQLDFSRNASMIDMEKLFKTMKLTDQFSKYKALYELIWKNGEEANKQMAEVFKNSDNYYQKLQVAQEQYNEKIEKARALFTKTDDTTKVEWFDQEGFDKYMNELARQFNTSKNKLLVEGLKQSLNWETIFGNLNNVRLDTLDAIEQTLEAMVKNSKDIDPTNLKSIMELINKVRDAKVSKEGFFGGIEDALTRIKSAQNTFKQFELVPKYTKELGDAISELNGAKLNGDMTTYFKLLNSKKKYKFSIDGKEQVMTMKEYLDALAQSEANVANGATLMQKNMKQFASRMQTIGKIVSNTVSAMGGKDTAWGRMASSLGGSFTGITDAISNIDWSKNFFGGGIDNILNNMEQMSSVASSLSSMVDTIREYKKEMVKIQNEYYDSMRSNIISIGNDIVERLEEGIKNATSSSEFSENLEKALSTKQSSETAYVETTIKKLSKSLIDYEDSNSVPKYAEWRTGNANRSVLWNMNNGQYDFINWTDIIERINKEFDRSFSGVEELFTALPTDAKGLDILYWLQNDSTARAALAQNDDLTGLVSQLIQLKEEEEDLNASAQFLGSTWDDFKDSFISACQDMDASAEDLANNIYDNLNNAIINAMFNAKFSDELKGLYDDIGTYYTNSEDGIDAGEMADIKNRADVLAEKIAEYREQMKEAGLLIDTDDSSSSSSSSISGISEETADILASYINEMRLDLSSQKLAVEAISSAIGTASEGSSLCSVAEAQLSQLVLQTGYLRMIAEHIQTCESHAENIVHTLEDTTNGVKAISIN